MGFLFLGIYKNGWRLLGVIRDEQFLFRGAVAKWQGTGLQNLYRRFDSASRLQNFWVECGSVRTIVRLVVRNQDA